MPRPRLSFGPLAPVGYGVCFSTGPQPSPEGWELPPACTLGWVNFNCVSSQYLVVTVGQPAQSALVEGLALTLFVTRIGADHQYPSVSSNDLAVFADLLDARLNFHRELFLVGSGRNRPQFGGCCSVLPVSVDDPAASQVIWR